MVMTLIVASAFLVKNILAKSYSGAMAIGICLFIFLVTIFIMRKFKISQYIKQLILSVCLVLLVTFISANSGNFYSDDFPLFLALLGLSGMYLEPAYTVIQSVLITGSLLFLYFLHPEKADPFSQYMMCVALFDVAAIATYLTIKRGRAFIEMSRIKAEEAERLINSIKTVEHELKAHCELSATRIAKMDAANRDLAGSTARLTDGSDIIRRGTVEVNDACNQVHQHMRVTESTIELLNDEVKKVEQALFASKTDMTQMDSQMKSVNETVTNTEKVFLMLQQQIADISAATNELTDIASNTKILAINASVEAARAGHHGAGFAVVASEVQRLAVDSNNCSDRVVNIVDDMKQQINLTSKQLNESAAAINASLNALMNLQNGFAGLMHQFNSLYNNIGTQNTNISTIDSIFGNLQQKVSEMDSHSTMNSEVVGSIAEAMGRYQKYINRIIADTQKLQDLSTSMLAETAAHE